MLIHLQQQQITDKKILLKNFVKKDIKEVSKQGKAYQVEIQYIDVCKDESHFATSSFDFIVVINYGHLKWVNLKKEHQLMGHDKNCYLKNR
ncbi:unnamed protein product [Paramecium pentaurelia]|uniref:Uncharacterized protein n=1 Tax=Paramecium pentaurelia TaxID=43138 RepID=A0A8S1S903_9CILI|nr:unnamed protein product [Paramecium pentaurelia]